LINHDYDSSAFNCFGKPVVQSENRGTDEKSISLTAQDFDLSATVQTRNSLLEEMNDDLIQMINLAHRSNGSAINKQTSIGSVSSFHVEQNAVSILFLGLPSFNSNLNFRTPLK